MKLKNDVRQLSKDLKNQLTKIFIILLSRNILFITLKFIENRLFIYKLYFDILN